ncbi:hypothetical protein [Micromonospora chokoriensis]
MIAATFLALLETRSRHGYDLDSADDRHRSRNPPLHHSQVYAVRYRLLKNGFVETGEPGDVLDRKRYAAPSPA